MGKSDRRDSKNETPLTESNVPQDGYSCFHVTRIQSIVEARHRITPGISNFLHFGELVLTARSEVEEGKLVKVLGLLISLLDNLQNTLGSFLKSRE